VVRPSPEQYELLHWWSSRSGTPIDELLLRSGLGAVPSAERRRFAARALHTPLMSAVSELLDSEPEDTRGVFPLPPSRRVLPVLAADENSLPDPSLWKEGHPCVFAVVKTDATLAPWPSGVEVPCVCVCWQPEQRGRPCHWETPVAVNCPVFEPRKRN
jgi:hypothetical protein